MTKNEQINIGLYGFLFVFVASLFGYMIGEVVNRPTEKQFKKQNFARCFYELVKLNLPYYAEQKGEWDLCDPDQPRHFECNPDISFLNSHNIAWMEGVCTGKTGGELMYDEPRWIKLE